MVFLHWEGAAQTPKTEDFRPGQPRGIRISFGRAWLGLVRRERQPPGCIRPKSGPSPEPSKFIRLGTMDPSLISLYVPEPKTLEIQRTWYLRPKPHKCLGLGTITSEMFRTCSTSGRLNTHTESHTNTPTHFFILLCFVYCFLFYFCFKKAPTPRQLRANSAPTPRQLRADRAV